MRSRSCRSKKQKKLARTPDPRPSLASLVAPSLFATRHHSYYSISMMMCLCAIDSSLAALGSARSPGSLALCRRSRSCCACCVCAAAARSLLPSSFPPHLPQRPASAALATLCDRLQPRRSRAAREERSPRAPVCAVIPIATDRCSPRRRRCGCWLHRGLTRPLVAPRRCVTDAERRSIGLADRLSACRLFPPSSVLLSPPAL